MLNVDFHIKRSQIEVTCKNDILSVNVPYQEYIEFYATPEQLQQIADTINGYLVCQRELQAQENQLAIHFEHGKALEVAS